MHVTSLLTPGNWREAGALGRTTVADQVHSVLLDKAMRLSVQHALSSFQADLGAAALEFASQITITASDISRMSTPSTGGMKVMRVRDD